MTELSAVEPTSKGTVTTPTPRINLSSLEHVRLEASRVYRDMRTGLIPTQYGSRLIYSLISISKMIEAEVVYKQVDELTVVNKEPSNILDGINLDKLTGQELDALEIAASVTEYLREGKPFPKPPPELHTYAISLMSNQLG
jgi:hypothetical protein